MSPGPRLQTTTEVAISPELRLAVVGRLEDYFALQAAIKELEAEANFLKADLHNVFEIAGEGAALDAGVLVEGKGRVKRVCGMTSKLDPKLLIAQGVTAAMLERATITKPSTPYIKISPPGRDAGSGD